MALLLVVGVIGREQPRAVVLVLLQLKGESEQVTETPKTSSDPEHKEDIRKHAVLNILHLLSTIRVSEVKPLLPGWLPSLALGTKPTWLRGKSRQ